MKWLVSSLWWVVIGLVPVSGATRTGGAISPLYSVSTADPVEPEFQRLMGLDDAAQEEIDKWIKENNAFQQKGAGLSEAVLSLKIEQRLAPVKQAYEAFLQRHPKHARAQLAFGSFLNDLGEEQEARKRWEKALELDPSNPAAYNNLANSYGQNGPVAKAFELYTKAIELNPRQAIYYHNLGSVLALHRKEAAAHYRISDQQVLRNALELYRLGQKFDPTNFQLATDLAQVYYGIQPAEPEAAIAAWTQALRLARDGLEREGVHLHLARAKAAAGQLNEARAHLNSVTNATLTAVKGRLTRELVEKALPPPAKDDDRRKNPP